MGTSKKLNAADIAALRVELIAELAEIATGPGRAGDKIRAAHALEMVLRGYEKAGAGGLVGETWEDVPLDWGAAIK